MIATTETTVGRSAEFCSLLQPATASTSASIRVWLTDDNASFRNSLASLLARSGEFNCDRQFHSAESLLDGLATGPAPDVILLDVEMGGMTGVDALRPIRALAPGVRVLIVTSFFDPMYDAQASRDGASAFLIKAYAPQNLVNEIRRALVSPIKMTAVVETAKALGSQPGSTAMESPTQELTAPKNLIARLMSWVVNLRPPMLGQMHYHRPAATSD